VDGREQSFDGGDEAYPSRGTLSYMSPLARAVLTHGLGETVEMIGGEAAGRAVGERAGQIWFDAQGP
jgi:transcription elongation GreA/GreB family factor